MRRFGSKRYVRQMPRIYGSLTPEPQHRVPELLGSFLRGFLGFGLLALVLYTVIWSPLFRVQSVKVEGVRFSSATVISQPVKLGMSMWNLPISEIKRAALADPTVTSVEVLRALPSSVRIVVTERTPALLWVSQGKVAVVDPNGYVFQMLDEGSMPDPATQLGTALAKVPLVRDTKNLPVTNGAQIVSARFVRFVDSILTDQPKTVPQVQLDHFEVADTIYDVSFLAKEGLNVQFNTLADPDAQLRNLERLLTQEKLPLTAQVDLRIDRWAYVRD